MGTICENHNLSKDEKNVLQKGLSFVPTFNNKFSSLQHNTDRLIRGLNIDHHFKDKPQTSTSKKTTNNTWYPPAHNNAELSSLTQTIEDWSIDIYNKSLTMPKDTDSKQITAITWAEEQQ